MFFPLGLGFRTKSFPYITWLIILVCVLFYAVGQQKEKYEIEYMSLQGHQEVERAHDHLFYEFCQKRVATGLCERFAFERGLFFERQEELPLLGEDFDASPEALMEFANTYDEFAQALERSKNKLNKLPSYLAYRSSLEKLNQQTQKIRERYNLLHHDNMNISSLITAIFSHENLLHLLGNMLFLFIFGRYVEARLGHAAYLGAYLFLGSAALGLYAWLNPQPFLHILGASANVSVVMGAFYALFFHHNIKIFFFYIGVKITDFPVKTFMFLFFMLQEFIFSMTATENVAYLAHAIGLLLGMAFGYAWAKSRPLPRDFLYEEELESWGLIRRGLEEKKLSKADFIDECLELLKYNPNNRTVMRAVVYEIAPDHLDLAGLDLEEELLLRDLMPSYLHNLYENGEFHELYRAIQRIPHSWSMSICLRKFGQKDLLNMIDRSIDEMRLMPAVLFIQAFVERYQNSPKIYNLLKTLKSVLDHMPLTDNCRRHLRKIKDLSSSDGVKVTINSRLIEER